MAKISRAPQNVCCNQNTATQTPYASIPISSNCSPLSESVVRRTTPRAHLTQTPHDKFSFS